MESAVDHPLMRHRLIGRMPEHAALLRLVAQANEGQGLVLVNAEEVNIGRTRLVWEVKSDATAQGFLLHRVAHFPRNRSCASRRS
jgi:hypothetical protein